jgi:quercetin dioxygenase-like cupin family protein
MAALGTNISALVEPSGAQVVSRGGARPRIPSGDPWSSVVLEQLIPRAEGRLLQGNIHVIPPGSGSEGRYGHFGEEMGYVLEGELTLTVDDDVYHLRKNDSFVFLSERPHGYYNPGHRNCLVIWVNTPPTF